MRLINYSKFRTGAAALLTAGVLLSGLSANAQQPYNGQQPERRYQEYQDLRYDRRDLRQDYGRVARLRADIERDRYRMNEAIRCGREHEAARNARDLARDQRALEREMRDVRSDRRDVYRDQRDLYRDSYRPY